MGKVAGHVPLTEVWVTWERGAGHVPLAEEHAASVCPPSVTCNRCGSRRWGVVGGEAAVTCLWVKSPPLPAVTSRAGGHVGVVTCLWVKSKRPALALLGDVISGLLAKARGEVVEPDR